MLLLVVLQAQGLLWPAAFCQGASCIPACDKHLGMRGEGSIPASHSPEEGLAHPKAWLFFPIYVSWANKSDYLFLPILPFSLIPQAVLQMSPSKEGAHIQL